MNMKKTLGITAAIAALGVSVWGSTAFAASTTKQNHMGDMISALATRFNLNQADVQKFFDEQHTKMEADHAAMEKTRLDQAVKDGKITQAQEDAIIAKHDEIEKLEETLKDKTPQERQAAMKTQMDSLKQWATDNKIPTEFFHFGFGKGPMGEHGHGPKGAHNEFFNKKIAPSTTK